MTASDALTMPHFRALCAAADADDDDTLMLAALADALEEMGDPRAAGMRLALECGQRPADHPLGCYWLCEHSASGDGPEVLSRSAFRAVALARGRADILTTHFGSRADAFLALAAALSE